MPAVSVIMAVKNSESTLLRAVNSIIEQTFGDFELLIGDDFSSDNTPHILSKLNDSRIKVLKASEQGLVPALNHCLTNATGQYISRMDSDDYAYPTRLEKQTQFLKDNPEIGVVSGLVNHVPTENNQEGYALYVREINKIITPEEHYFNRFRDAPLANPSATFRTSLLKEFGDYKQFDGPEDYEFWLRLMNAGVLFMKLKEPVLDWYDYSYRLTRNNSNYSSDAFHKLKAKYFAEWWTNQARTNRKIWVWGFGKDVFNKSKWLEEHGVTIEGYIDITEKPTSRKKIHYSKIIKQEMFILVYVSDRKGQQNISNWFTANWYEPTKDYYFMT